MSSPACSGHGPEQDTLPLPDMLSRRKTSFVHEGLPCHESIELQSGSSNSNTPGSLRVDSIEGKGEVKTLTEETHDSFGVPGERFVLKELLGEGSFGAVYRCAKDGSDGEEYAVKVINAMRISMLVGHPLELVTPRLRREVEILKHLGEHPRILKLYFAYYSATTHRFYVVTELLRGGELFQAIIRRRRPFSEPESRKIFSQLVDAVAFCHRQGVAHRDLKLENCLFEDQESLNVKLCDYGQAKVLHGEGFIETAKTLTTTPAYTAPEVASAVQSARPYDAFKADSFGLGVILYGLLCSALPDAAKGANYERHRRWRSLSQEAHDLIRQLLASDPTQRPSPERVRCHPWLLSRDEYDNVQEATVAIESVAKDISSTSPVHCRFSVEAILAAQQVIVALQRERGTCCWGLGSQEGEESFRWQLQHTDEKFKEMTHLIEQLAGHGEVQDSTWTAMLTVFNTSGLELKKLRKNSALKIKRRDETLDGEEDFTEVFAGYSLLIAKAITAAGATLSRFRHAGSQPTSIELRHGLLQLAAEQLARERGFISGHLARPETLRLFGVVTQLAEIIGARKMLLGSSPTSARHGVIVAADQGLLLALRLSEAPPIDSNDLATLESMEEHVMS